MLTRSDLRPYQERAVEFVKNHERCALWLDPGLGKTVSALTAFGDLLRTFDARRMLVVAPKRVASKVWADEIKEWAHLEGLTVSVAKGTWQEKFDALKKPADIHTINRES